MIVDYEGRILAQADPGPGEKIVVAGIDLSTLRAERERRMGHHMLGHLRTEAYQASRGVIYPRMSRPPSIEANEAAILKGKQNFTEPGKRG